VLPIQINIKCYFPAKCKKLIQSMQQHNLIKNQTVCSKEFSFKIPFISSKLDSLFIKFFESGKDEWMNEICVSKEAEISKHFFSRGSLLETCVLFCLRICGILIDFLRSFQRVFIGFIWILNGGFHVILVTLNNYKIVCNNSLEQVRILLR
jgi:hypothetical protein